MSGAHRLLQRARLDGRLPPRVHKSKVPNNIPARVRRAAALIEAGLSRRELAAALGVSYQSIYLTCANSIAGRRRRDRPPKRNSAALRRCAPSAAPKPQLRASVCSHSTAAGHSTDKIADVVALLWRKVTEAERIARTPPALPGAT